MLEYLQDELKKCENRKEYLNDIIFNNTSNYKISIEVREEYYERLPFRIKEFNLLINYFEKNKEVIDNLKERLNEKDEEILNLKKELKIKDIIRFCM
jgi:hypothetical protein